ncbi:hypothetical protein B0H17DRAFT_9478 [Mycena rosella]|uniref:Uncharacterized protein n=1 Tax=Mycena rosella TaxID=1033263 RepID=A0AAD7GSJ4_MYCRO|nr:hypothetical protein B0H17DRAFT_9478 [Mycena rosella]
MRAWSHDHVKNQENDESWRRLMSEPRIRMSNQNIDLYRHASCVMITLPASQSFIFPPTFVILAFPPTFPDIVLVIRPHRIADVDI